MNQEQKRIKLAEAGGWTNCCTNNQILWPFTGAIGCPVGGIKVNGLSEMRPIPDYFNDLNAIHELRSKLTDQQKEVFAYTLAYSERVKDGEQIGYIELPPIDTFDVINASADAQAEAIGKTLNLW